MGLVDLVQGVAGGDQHLFRRAAAIGAGAAEIARLDHATVMPALRVGTVTPKPALPPPRIKTSQLSRWIAALQLAAIPGRADTLGYAHCEVY